MANTDVSGQLATAGLAFGDLVKLTGQAVADTQQTLNKTAADSTSTLAQTLVDVVAVQEVDYDDNGNITGAKSFTQNLPLIDYVDPVLYQWSQVRLQGKFMASQFATTSSSDSSNLSTSDDSGQAGLFIVLGGGYTSVQLDESSTHVDTNFRMESSVGLMRMNAILEPRHDIGVPKPRQAVVGPRIAIEAGPIANVGPNNAPTSRTMEVVLTYTKADDTPIAGKTLSIETPGVGWSYKSGVDQTDGSGQVTIVMERAFIGDTPDYTPIDVVVSARKGLVGDSATMTF
jgi:hypothetical protein